MDTNLENQSSDQNESHLRPSEKQLKKTLEKLRECLSQKSEKYFKEFWETKKKCLLLFKESIHPALRKQFWTEYIELSNEAKKLKELLDQQSDYTAQQIEKAIQSLDQDLEKIAEIANASSVIEIPNQCNWIDRNREFYQSTQALLDVYNSFASRIHSLRKELIQVDVRMKQKNQFFKLLSKKGNEIFPKRKELIESISKKFQEDVREFIKESFGKNEHRSVPFYQIKDQIKHLQAFAKVFTLNAQSFKSTREELSSYWDQIREKEVAYKQMKNEKNKDEPKKQRENERYKERAKPVKETIDTQKEEQQKKQEQLKEEFSVIKQTVLDTFDQIEKYAPEALKEIEKTIQKAFEHNLFAVAQKEQLEQYFHQLQDWICEKNEETQELHSLEQLQTVLDQKKERRNKIKLKVDHCRKTLGNSNLDFETSFLLQEMFESEKQHLEKMNASIEAIEDRILDIES